MVTSAAGAASEMSRTNASQGDMCNITILNGTLLTGKENINTDLKLACRDHVMNLPNARTNIGCFRQSHIEKPLLCIKKNQEDEVQNYHENNVMFERKGCSQLILSSMPQSMVRNKIMKSGKDFPNSLASGGAVVSNLENPLELHLGLSLVSHVSGVPDKKLNSVDSAIRGSYASQVQYGMRTYTKVYMRGRVGRSIDIERYSGYHELRKYLARVFGLEGQLEDRYRIGAKLVYVDHENDVIILGNDPWEEFVSCVKSIKILSPQEVQQLSLSEHFPDSVFPNEVNGNSNGLYPPLPYSFKGKSTPISGSRYTGSIMGIRDLNPAGWNTLNWPKFQVGCGMKRPRQPQMLDYDFSHLDSLCKKIIPLLGDDFAMMDDQALHSLHSVMQMNMHQSLSLANSTEPNYLHSLSCSLLKYRTGGGLSCHLGVSHQENNLHLSAQRSTTSLLLDQLQKSHAVSPCLSPSSSSSCVSRFRKLLRKATYKSESASVNQPLLSRVSSQEEEVESFPRINVSLELKLTST